jgi:hypothetical protein
MHDNRKPDVEVDIVESLASLFMYCIAKRQLNMTRFVLFHDGSLQYRGIQEDKHDQVVLFHDSSLQYRGIQEL